MSLTSFLLSVDWNDMKSIHHINHPLLPTIENPLLTNDKREIYSMDEEIVVILKLASVDHIKALYEDLIYVINEKGLTPRIMQCMNSNYRESPTAPFTQFEIFKRSNQSVSDDTYKAYTHMLSIVGRQKTYKYPLYAALYYSWIRSVLVSIDRDDEFERNVIIMHMREYYYALTLYQGRSQQSKDNFTKKEVHAEDKLIIQSYNRQQNKSKKEVLDNVAESTGTNRTKLPARLRRLEDQERIIGYKNRK
ncbi:MAG: hypothetical protein ACJATV_000564 [Granulosicoccus sp.]|jgi:hypothetical protein